MCAPIRRARRRCARVCRLLASGRIRDDVPVPDGHAAIAEARDVRGDRGVCLVEILEARVDNDDVGLLGLGFQDIGELGGIDGLVVSGDLFLVQLEVTRALGLAVIDAIGSETTA